MDKDTAHTLGQIFGRLIAIENIGATNALEREAMIYPMKSITILYERAIQARKLDSQSEKYIREMFDKLDANTAIEQITDDVSRSAFVIGMTKGRLKKESKNADTKDL